MENWVNNCKCLLLKTVKMLDHRSLHFVLFDRKLHTNSQRKNSQRLFYFVFLYGKKLYWPLLWNKIKQFISVTQLDYLENESNLTEKVQYKCSTVVRVTHFQVFLKKSFIFDQSVIHLHSRFPHCAQFWLERNQRNFGLKTNKWFSWTWTGKKDQSTGNDRSFRITKKHSSIFNCR